MLIQLFSDEANPRLLAAKISVQVSKIMYGRKFDVIIEAPNLVLQPIHKNVHLYGSIL